ncbi:MAG TPA: zf-HC2 domain-containing protein, partial [Vicinamibacterales bacterium]
GAPRALKEEDKQMQVMCDNKELILGYVYDELPPGERQAFTDHVSGCPECQMELEELRATRMHLALWSPPEPDLGFRVIRGGAAPAPALPRRNRFVSALGYAAAAMIVLAAASGIANLEVRYDGDGMTVRTGWARASGAASRVAGTSAASTAQPVSASPSQAFAELDARLRQLEGAMSSGGATLDVQNASTSRMSDAELIRTVRQIVREAEARQETANVQRLLQMVKDWDNQRRADLAWIQQGLGHYQGLTNAEIAQNRDMLNQFIRAAATRQEK